MGVLLLVLLDGGFFGAVHLLFAPVQVRIWNYFNALDFLLMTALVLPFLATRWWPGLSSRSLRLAWYCTAIMAADIAFFGVGTFFPTGGHPSLEAILSVFLGVAKVLLVPFALIALNIAWMAGQSRTAIGLGFLCVLTQTLYTVPIPHHPFLYLAARH